MVKKYLYFFIFLFFVSSAFTAFKAMNSKDAYLVAGTGNPGKIILYRLEKNEVKLLKTIDTGFKFVYTVRVGDIYNNQSKHIIAGVSNSLSGDPYGCQVVSYDLVSFKPNLIDNVGDLRCKDLTIGDADNDGENEVLLGTHGQGIVRLYKWLGSRWSKEDLELNYISQVDKEKSQDHRVPNDQLPCEKCLIQTAVHIVKIADADNDGENEVIATMSSPLELQDQDEISFVKIYKKTKDGGWRDEVVDQLTNREFRSITLGDIYNKGKNTLVIGIGSPRNEKGSLYAYEYKDNRWEKAIIHNDIEEKNMKGVSIADMDYDGKTDILLATGFPNAKVIKITWEEKKFKENNLGTISELFENRKKGEFNSMAANIIPNSKSEFFVAGMTTFPKDKIGWEGTDKGFIVHFKEENGKMLKQVVEKGNVLGMDLYPSSK